MALLLEAAIGSAAAARAQVGTAGESEETAAAEGGARGGKAREIGWPEAYPDVRIAEMVAAPVLVTTAFVLFTVPEPPEPELGAGNAFDRELQEAFSVRSATYQKAAAITGHAGFYGSMVYRAFDAGVMAGAVRGSWELAWRLAVIDAMAFGLVGSVVWGSQMFVERQRPKDVYCATDPTYEAETRDCAEDSTGANRSFISGHVATAVAGASLTCLHHARFPIYERPWGKRACATHAVAAGVVGAMRSTGDDHWPTDILLGVALGMVAGWVLPRALHYGWDHYGFGEEVRETEGEGEEGARARRGGWDGRPRVFLAPWASHEQGGARLIGMF